MTTDYQRGYSKGYARGQRNAWPEHKPPLPPQSILADLLAAANAMRDATDAELAKFAEDDDIVLKIGPKIDAYDEAMSGLTEWLKSSDDGFPVRNRNNDC